MLRSLAHRLVRHQKLARERRYRTLNTVYLSRAAALHNIALIQKQHPKSAIIPVLKSNAYGHGLKEMAEILNGADCAFLAVDGYFEAAQIRHISRHRLLVLGFVSPENTRLVDTRRCSFVVQDIAGLEAFGRLGRKVRIHVELNTGMNRLGLDERELSDYLTVLKQYHNLELEGVMSHLAEADNPHDSKFTARQVETFNQIVKSILDKGFRPKYAHIAQTAGSTKANSVYTNAIRLGIGLYGISPLDPTDPQAAQLAGLWPVMSLTSTIIKVIHLRPGDTVGYNRTFVAKKPMKIGVLPIGYYEGLPRVLSSKGTVTAKGEKLPIVGRVSMNHTMVGLSEKVGMGDKVTVFSSDPHQDNSITGTARTQHLFAYGLMTGIASSIRREIV